tara:strand:+ start:6792 stop:7511 length:720 start_codon:yes stop_codon:yes gene_type:complete
MSNNLVRVEVAEAQSSKYLTINTSDGDLDAAITERLAVAITVTNLRTLTGPEFTDAVYFDVDEDGGSPAIGAITLTVPAIKRGMFVVVNNTAFTVDVEIAAQPLTAPQIVAGDITILTCDGTNVLQPVGAAAAAGSTIDIPTEEVGTTYTLALTDDNALVRISNAAANTITIPPNSTVAFDIGAVVSIAQTGAGKTSVAAGAGVTINSAGSLLDCRVQYSTLSAMKIATDTWILTGDLA